MQKNNIFPMAFFGMLVLLATVGIFNIKHKTKPKLVKVTRLKPVCNGNSCTGSVAYKNDEDVWLYYNFMFTSDSSSYPVSSSSSSLPSGGTWIRGTAAPKTEEIEAETEAEVDTEATDADSNAESEAQVESDSTDSSDSDSSADSGSDFSSDSGADFGGDAGGDGGGGE